MDVKESEHEVKLEFDPEESVEEFLIELGYRACKISAKVGLGLMDPVQEINRNDLEQHFSGDWFSIDYYHGRCVKLFCKIKEQIVTINKFFDRDHHDGALMTIVKEVEEWTKN